ncbi:MAG: hypothetical protein GY904_05810 [Planctomycetaceae bacterium]|nr:hypothetical protein [Planctomycetaceae bacterium]
MITSAAEIRTTAPPDVRHDHADADAQGLMAYGSGAKEAGAKDSPTRFGSFSG